MPKRKGDNIKIEPTDEMPVEVDFSPEKVVVGRGIYADEAKGGKPLKVTYVVVDDQSLKLILKDGRQIAAPLDWYPRLRHASPAERNDWTVIMGGRSVRWPAVELAISAKALIDGTKAFESAASLKKWLAARQPQHRKAS